MRKETADKLNSIGHGSAAPFVEPHESYTKVKPGAVSVQQGGNKQSVDKKLGHPHSNLGKFLHPKKSGYTPNSGKPASMTNKTIDANTGGAKVRATQ